MTDLRVPGTIPVLSQGRHRNPHKGACFMEMASFLAGERWSDHPACTHPLLAAVARLVNDNTSDARRQRLATLIPSVIGLTSDDPRVDVRISLRAATQALPIVAAERQRVMAVSVLMGRRVLAELPAIPGDDLIGQASEALAGVPDAARWADEFTQGVTIAPAAFRRRAAPRTVRCAVEGIAAACVSDPDDHLYAVLVGAIEECERVAGRPRSPEPGQPATGPRPHSPATITR
jgi:hypothetical protein